MPPVSRSNSLQLLKPNETAIILIVWLMLIRLIERCIINLCLCNLVGLILIIFLRIDGITPSYSTFIKTEDDQFDIEW